MGENSPRLRNVIKLNMTWSGADESDDSVFMNIPLMVIKMIIQPIHALFMKSVKHAFWSEGQLHVTKVSQVKRTTNE